ncbi:hypothetical protein B0H13DRAFT_2326832 [Mycena leptocephala]|nr:hypothetical protein B0H13DRAFT_2326832 [Mycena leptocephala]
MTLLPPPPSPSPLRLPRFLPQALSASFEAEYEARPTKRARRSIRLRRRSSFSTSLTSSTPSTSFYLFGLDQRPLLIPPVFRHHEGARFLTSFKANYHRRIPPGLHRHTFEDEAVYLTPVDDLHVVYPYVEDVQIDEDHPMSDDYSHRQSPPFHKFPPSSS